MNMEDIAKMYILLREIHGISLNLINRAQRSIGITQNNKNMISACEYQTHQLPRLVAHVLRLVVHIRLRSNQFSKFTNMQSTYHS